MYDFYLASPFFNEEQSERERRICKTLREAGFTVFAPFEQGVLTPEATQTERDEIFYENVKALNLSSYVLAITDGKDIGTIWEAGYGYARGKQIIYYAETLGKNPFNVMLGKSSVGIFTNYEEFKKACKTRNFRNNSYKNLRTQ